MARPILRINGFDYTEYVDSLTPSRNGLNADGSSRDVETGLMFRIKITDKQKWDVKMMRLPADIHHQLAEALKEDYYEAVILDPETNRNGTRTFYTDTVPFGAQRYNKSEKCTFYDGMSFTMTER